MVLELRSGAKINHNNSELQNGNTIVENNNVGSPSKKSCQTEDANGMTLVVFFGLLIDLLAFTLILPLFPALLDHYKKHDSSHGLYHFLDSRVSIVLYFDLLLMYLCTVVSKYVLNIRSNFEFYKFSPQKLA